MLKLWLILRKDCTQLKEIEEFFFSSSTRATSRELCASVLYRTIHLFSGCPKFCLRLLCFFLTLIINLKILKDYVIVKMNIIKWKEGGGHLFRLNCWQAWMLLDTFCAFCTLFSHPHVNKGGDSGLERQVICARSHD